jgi:hypothetical protein
MQFTKEQMICNATNCDEADTSFIDCTRGPLYDGRFYCDEHMPAVKERESKLHREAALSYQYSVVADYAFKLEQARIKLEEMENEIHVHT